MKILYDYFPIICFFIAYKLYGIYVATGVTMLASLLQIAFFWVAYRRFEKLHLIMLGLVFLLGGATLIFHNEMFIKWKPSVIYWIFGILLISSHFFGEKPIIHRLLGDKVELPKKAWHRINIAWGIFFLALGGLNLYVVYHYTTNAWVNFKLFGTLGLTLLFAILQVLYMWRHMEKNGTEEK